MRMLVCVKQVPDTAEITVDPLTHRLLREGVPSILNTFDRYALELALRLKEALGVGCVTVLSMGPAQAEAVLRECLALGADSAYLASDAAFGGSDTLATSTILARAAECIAAKEGPFGAIFCGKQAIDGDTAQVGPEMAEHLNIPQATNVTETRYDDGRLHAKRETEEGYEILALSLPCLLSVTKPPFEPRYASARGKLATKRAPVEILNRDILQLDRECIGLKGSPTRVRKTYTPQVHKGGILVQGEEGEMAASGLFAFLQASNLIGREAPS